ncbi:MAG TPA: phosphogluconate dehydrogenase [Clostridiales bacterium]|nr:phosphogluconate dehydrogenase [Clostridiales bacterium]
MKQIGFIGMGIMGLPMAVNLVNKGKLSVKGFDIAKSRRKIFEENGGSSVDNTESIYESCDVIFLCLPTNELVKSNIKQILSNGIKGALIVDLSSTAPSVIRKMYQRCRQAGMSLLDSPVSGGETGAVEGTLAIMCGGDKEAFDEAEPLLSCIGRTVTYMGSTGCGAVAKLANNMIVGCYIGAVSEALAFAAKAGLDPSTLYRAIKDGFAGSAVLDLKAPKIIGRNFKPSARIAVHQKDLKNAVKLAEELNIEIPLSETILKYMDEIEADGMVNEDHCAIAKIYEKRMGVEIK